jgi:hypothetical protein
VADVLLQNQQNKIKPVIIPRDSWGLFLLENEDGKYADIVNLGKKQAIARINSDKKLLEELEPVLARERFAQIIMDVSYDLSGEKEQRLSTVSFNRALKKGNQALAQQVLEFITRRIREGRYPVSVLDSLTQDNGAQNVAVSNNIIYQKYSLTNSLDEEDLLVTEKNLKQQPAEPVLQYNTVFCKLKLDSNAGDPAHRNEVQQTIDGLYGKLDSSLVNGLNIEWQFRILESLDTLPDAAAQVEACISRIKTFYKIRDASWQNALKLSQVFVKARDFAKAASILEPFLKDPKVNENLVFMYVSCASRTKEKYHSRTFAKALQIAKEKNAERYCRLFGEPYMTFQVLENPEVKRTYQLSCGK